MPNVPVRPDQRPELVRRRALSRVLASRLGKARHRRTNSRQQFLAPAYTQVARLVQKPTAPSQPVRASRPGPPPLTPARDRVNRALGPAARAGGPRQRPPDCSSRGHMIDRRLRAVEPAVSTMLRRIRSQVNTAVRGLFLASGTDSGSGPTAPGWDILTRESGRAPVRTPDWVAGEGGSHDGNDPSGKRADVKSQLAPHGADLMCDVPSMLRAPGR